MRRRRVIIVLAACILVGIGVVAFWPREREPKEPEYNGKKLTEWMRPYEQQYLWHGRVWVSEEDQKVVDDAVRHMGTNALPWMVKWIAYEPPAWKAEFWRILSKLPVNLTARLFPKHNYSELDGFRIDAAMAFKILGPEAAPAVPALSRMVNEPRYVAHRDQVLWALSFTGRDGLPALLGALNNESWKHFAARCIVRMCVTGVDITKAMPAILMIDHETSEIVKKTNRQDYIYAIEESDYWRTFDPSETKHPEFLVSALTNCMHHTDLVIQVEAINGLGRLGRIARPAVPVLKEALDVRIIAVQEAAVEALEKIAPGVLTIGASEVNP